MKLVLIILIFLIPILCMAEVSPVGYLHQELHTSRVVIVVFNSTDDSYEIIEKDTGHMPVLPPDCEKIYPLPDGYFCNFIEPAPLPHELLQDYLNPLPKQVPKPSFPVPSAPYPPQYQ